MLPCRKALRHARDARPDQPGFVSGSALLHAEHPAARFRRDEHGSRTRAESAAHRSSACRQADGPARCLETGWQDAEAAAGWGAEGSSCRTRLFIARSRASPCPLNAGCGRICGWKWKRRCRKLARVRSDRCSTSDSVTQVWDDFLSQRTSWSRVWSLYVLERWCELNSVSA